VVQDAEQAGLGLGQVAQLAERHPLQEPPPRLAGAAGQGGAAGGQGLGQPRLGPEEDDEVAPALGLAGVQVRHLPQGLLAGRGVLPLLEQGVG
jgi:hypothetical protein